ncbi:hypothetical protein [Massilia consociata]|uniref:Uncharacterized protein n=1 Tax=Massilia consociata TaxID=760117 RepID=A0ABV6FIV8_9BURK
MFKKINFIAMPLLVGSAMGIVAGGAIVLLGEILSFDYSPTQKIWAFTGFVILGVLFGIVDSIHRLLTWLPRGGGRQG